MATDDDGTLDCTCTSAAARPATATTTIRSQLLSSTETLESRPARPHYCPPFLGHCDLDKPSTQPARQLYYYSYTARASAVAADTKAFT